MKNGFRIGRTRRDRGHKSSRIAAKPGGSCSLEALETRLLLSSVTPFDINPGLGGSNPGAIVEAGGLQYFSANDGTHGTELWVLDGTSPRVVTDLVAGSGSSNPTNLTAWGNRLLFTAAGPDGANHLYITDGSDAGTVALTTGGSSFGSFCPVGNRLFFAASIGMGIELYATDGSAAGTTLVKDINPNASSSSPNNLVAVGSLLYFTATDGVTGKELWRSDGTTGGTYQVIDLRSGSLSTTFTSLFEAGGRLVFVADKGTGGSNVWTSDGTAEGTTLLGVARTNLSSTPTGAITVGNLTYFMADDGVHGRELWVTDGTGDGTHIVSTAANLASPPLLTYSNGVIFFVGTGAGAGTELWKSDGTAQGTSLVKDIVAGSGSASPGLITPFGTGVLFSTTSPAGFWFSDGTSDGTVQVANGTPTACAVMGAQALFSVNSQLWVTDGTAAGTSHLADVTLVSIAEAGNGQAIFVGNNIRYGSEMWISDGTSAGTHIITDLNTTTGDSYPDQFVSCNGLTFFRAKNMQFGWDVWVTDGTEGGTHLVKDMYPGAADAMVSFLTVFQGRVYFIGSNGVAGELWSSDGTEAGTVRIGSLSASNVFSWLRPAQDCLYFCTTYQAQCHLWKTDGTSMVEVGVMNTSATPWGVAGNSIFMTYSSGLYASNGTSVAQIEGSAPATGFAWAGKMYYSKALTGGGWELWASDGTPAGTARVVSCPSKVTTGAPWNLFIYGDHLYFTADDGVHGRELWATDGTTAGTKMVREVNDVNSGSLADPPITIGSIVYFRANDGVHSAQVWRSDGTAEGTWRVSDITPYTSNNLGVNWTYAVGDKLYFSGDHDLWVTDGTTAGTTRLAGGFTMGPDALASFQGRLCFRAQTAAGWQIWSSDGTVGGTSQFTNLLWATGSSGSGVNVLKIVHDRLILWAADDAGGRMYSADATGGSIVKLFDYPAGAHATACVLPSGNGVVECGNSAVGYVRYLTDGTVEGTQLLSNEAGFSIPEVVYWINNRMVYICKDIAHGYEWWSSDGTLADVHLVKDINPGPDSSAISGFTQVGDKVYFSANDERHGTELWVTDGTTEGTHIYVDLNHYSPGSNPSTLAPSGSWLPGDANRDGKVKFADYLTLEQNFGKTGMSWATGDFNGDGAVKFADYLLLEQNFGRSAPLTKYYFLATNENGQDLYVIDGNSPAQTVKSLVPGVAWSGASMPTVVNGVAYFVANDASGRTCLWKTDATAGGTACLLSLPYVYPGTVIRNLTNVAGRLFFSAIEAADGEELWVSDGTVAGTQMVTNLSSGSGSSSPSNIIAFHGKAYFFAQTDLAERLCVSDGTAAGTAIFTHLRVYSASNLIVANDKLLFMSRDGADGPEYVCVSDGTDVGTRMLWDPNPSPLTNSPLVACNGRAFFLASAEGGGVTLWADDGTAPGMAALHTGNPGNLTALGGLLYFTDSSGGSDILYCTDGSVSGTRTVYSSTDSQQRIGSLVAVGQRIYFIGNHANDATRHELWVFDGSTARPIAAAGSGVANLSAGDEGVFFQADDGITGPELWFSDGTEQGTAMRDDLNAATSSSSPTNIVVIGDLITFVTNDPFHGSRSWAIQPSGEVTPLASDAPAGLASFSNRPTVVCGDSLYFCAYDTNGSYGLWKTTGGLKDSVLMGLFPATFPSNLCVANGHLLFQASDGVHGIEWWTTDGTAGGTHMLVDINNVSAGANFSTGVNMNGVMYFLAAFNNQTQLWRNDGTPGGYSKVGQWSINAILTTLFASQDRLYFNGTGGLWASDGTAAGTQNIKSGNPASFFQAGNYVYFMDSGLWRTDGPAAGTVLLKSSGISNITTDGTHVYFVSTDPWHGQEPWTTDGTVAGTHLLADVENSSQSASPTLIGNVGQEVYFTTAGQVWQTDGTAAGTVRPSGFPMASGTQTAFNGKLAYAGANKVWIVDETGSIYSLPPSTSGTPSMAVVGNTLYFTALSGGNVVLWKTDGSVAGTVAVQASSTAIGPQQLTAAEGLVYFLATDSAGLELWRSDGTDGGTFRLGDLAAGSASPTINWMQARGSQLLFSLTDATHGAEPWISDGTVAGTQLLRDLNTVGSSSVSVSNAVKLGSRVFFTANDGLNGNELWSTDGTTSGTQMLKDIATSGSSSPSSLKVWGNRLLFVATTPTTGAEPWITDGTAAGTVCLGDLYPGSGGSSVANWTLSGNMAYFTAYDSLHGTEPWVTDGTPGGTHLAADLTIGVFGSTISNMTGGNGLLFFTFADANGTELWQSDGSASGTFLAADLNPGSAGSYPGHLFFTGGRLLFAADDGSHGVELFVYDPGTPSGMLLEAAVSKTQSVQAAPAMAASGTIDLLRIDPLSSVIEAGHRGTGQLDWMNCLSSVLADGQLSLQRKPGHLWSRDFRPAHLPNRWGA